MAIIARLFMVLLAYVLACIAASTVLTIGTLTPQWDQLAPQGLPVGGAVGGGRRRRRDHRRRRHAAVASW